MILLQGIFPTQGSNLGLPHWGQILYHPSYQRMWEIKDAWNGELAVWSNISIPPLTLRRKLFFFFSENRFEKACGRLNWGRGEEQKAERGLRKVKEKELTLPCSLGRRSPGGSQPEPLQSQPWDDYHHHLCLSHIPTVQNPSGFSIENPSRVTCNKPWDQIWNFFFVCLWEKIDPEKGILSMFPNQ